ncbi:MAG: STAS domain-containing protein [Terriglobales bacterium]
MLKIEQDQIGDATVLKPVGRISFGHDCQQVEWAVDELLTGQHKKVVLDLSEITHLDSSGVGILVMCSGKLKTARGELRLAGAAGAVEQTLIMTQLASIVPIFKTVAEALQGFTEAARA